MAKKSESIAMKEILTRVEHKFEHIRTIVFPQETVLQGPVDTWPLCDCLIAFHSKGFPLEKALAYVKLRKPYLINKLEPQVLLQDRRKVYEILKRERVPIPRYAVVDNFQDGDTGVPLCESPTSVTIQDVTFHKPFVEKPVSAEDHNVYIYYPPSSGGGCQRLFRKVGGWCSLHSSESQIRRTGGPHIYEDFIPTNGMDVKVYTVGPNYAHAEARRSPALDGKVERDGDGKERRYPISLTPAEKLIAKRICLVFQQTICGFDLLRGTDGVSYVCDVNGFSFVKNSAKYYDECANILGTMVLGEVPGVHEKLC